MHEVLLSVPGRSARFTIMIVDMKNRFIKAIGCFDAPPGCPITMDRQSFRFLVMAAAFVSLVCIAVYHTALEAQFVSWDDYVYVVENTAIRQLDTNLLKWAFSPPSIDLWIPLTWLSLAMDYHIWNLDPFGYHLTNILLHSLNAGLVVLIAAQLLEGTQSYGKFTTSQSMTVLVLSGIIFGIHPLRVESVAWVSERKDVLSGAFSLGAMAFYLNYAKWREKCDKSFVTGLSYVASLALFIGALLSKPTSVMLPLLFLVSDVFPSHRWRTGNVKKILVEKVPFGLLAVTVVVMTLYFSRAMVSLQSLSLGQRFLVSGNAVCQYIQMTLLPVGILPLHVIPAPIPISYYLKTIAVVLLCLLCVRLKRGNTAVLAVLLAFVVPLLPVLGFFQNGLQAFAARYTYLPSVPISIAAAMTSMLLWRTVSGRFSRGAVRFAGMFAIGTVLSLVIFYAVLTQRLISVWMDSGTLWTRVITHQPFDMAYFWRGMHYDRTVGDLAAALEDYSTSIVIAHRSGRPGIDNMYAYRGEVLRKMSRYEESLSDYSMAIAYNPQPQYYIGRAVTFKLAGETVKAQRDIEQAEKLKRGHK